MKKIRVLALSLILLLIFTTLTKASVSPSINTEIKLKNFIKSINKEKILYSEGVILEVNEIYDLSKFTNIKIEDRSIVSFKNGIITAKAPGTTFISFYDNGNNYVMEVGVISSKSELYSIPKNNTILESTNKYKVYIDPGHGGTDSGAVSGVIFEKEQNLITALYVKAILKAQGVEVLLTREDDIYVSLLDRVAIVNAATPTLMVSIHYNAATVESANGIETYYDIKKRTSYKLASSIQNKLINLTDAYDRGVKTATFTVITKTKAPSALVEGGFITNFNEASEILKGEYKMKVAQGIADGIMAYLAP